MKIERDMHIYSYVNENFKKPEKVSYEFESLSKKYNVSYADIHHVCDLIMLGNEYEDTLIIPDYQRDLVWTLDQKQKLILSILYGNPIGDFIFRKDRDRLKGEIKITWSVIDGQQRLNAIKEFVTGVFTLPDGRTFEELGYWDAREFLTNYKISALSVQGITREQELELYYKRNFGGTAHTLEDLEKFKQASSI